jgi:hypothetical protein
VTLPATSGFWAYGRLSPFGLTKFNVQEVPVADDTYVECCADGLAVWSKAGSEFARSVEDAREYLSLVVASYTVTAGVALDFSFAGWVEAFEATFDNTMVGVFVDERGSPPMGHPEARRSRLMRDASTLAARVFHKGGWRLAVRDTHTAQRALERGSDDCFVFAYRAIEDLAHALSAGRDKSWPALHAHLGTTQEAFKRRIEPLRLARNAAGHGDETDPELEVARAKSARLVSLSRRIVREAIAADPSLSLA